MVSEYEMRTEGLLPSRRTHIDVYLSNSPGPRNERGLRHTFVDETLDNEYEKGGIDAVKAMLYNIVRGLIEQVVNTLADDYKKEADLRLARERKARFGPLGAFLEIGRPDVIHKIALEDHEKRKGEQHG